MQKQKEALFYELLEDRWVQCYLCPHNCRIFNQGLGKCGVRENDRGKLYTFNYGKIAAYNLDPIEKKPLYHFYPGSKIFSIGSIGCNLKCSFCQNWSIAHTNTSAIFVTPQNIVEIAKKESDNIGIAYTYNEPSIWYEFVYETAVLAHQEGLKNVLVTNGFIQKEPLRQILPYIDGMNIDLKAFNDEFYYKLCQGRLSPVKETIKEVAGNCHMEITTLVIGDINDSIDEIERLSRWIAKISPDIPLHLSRYFPAYKMNQPPTSIHSLINALETAKNYLHYVYMGNVQEANLNTYCPECGNKIIDRSFVTTIKGFSQGKCSQCGKHIPIIV